MYGIDAKDTLRIVADKPTFELKEDSILWYEKEPRAAFIPTSPDYNYKIIGIKPSLNEVVFYARKVDVST